MQSEAVSFQGDWVLDSQFLWNGIVFCGVSPGLGEVACTSHICFPINRR